MVEIYNEKLIDLMSERNTQLTIREATSGFFSIYSISKEDNAIVKIS